MQIKPINNRAYNLLHEGALALSDIESNGIRIDVRYCESQLKSLERRIIREEQKLNEFAEVKLWKNIFKEKFNLDSNPQLSKILFTQLKLPSMKLTEKMNNSVDKDVLDSIDIPFVKKIVELRKLKKIVSTYLGNIIREQVDGILKPFFNLHTVRTYRGSCSNINFQNIPIRDPLVGEIIRRAFIPREGHQIGGADYSGIEVRAAVFYHKDPAMIRYIIDPTFDMHRDMAMDCFLLKKEEVTKDCRFYAKNNFVFPQFYGDWYVDCAMGLWKAIESGKLKTVQGLCLKEHLKKQGIKSYKSFENHIRDVEYDFWNKRFPIYAEWKKEWMKRYEKNGYFDLLTGFRCSGFMGRNEVINYPIQGVAFHCLLWSLIKLNDWYKKMRLKSKLIGQIHDEITMDNHAEELSFILSMSKQIMCEDIRQEWEWINVPLDIEAEFGGVDESWYYKKSIGIKSLQLKEKF